jgi:hypothetical protein
MDPLYIPLFFGGGARKPVLDGDALQWVVGYESDGDYTDKLFDTVGVASPEATSTNIVSYDGATNYSTAQVGVAGLTDTATVHLSVRSDASVSNVYSARLGSYLFRITDATTLRVYPASSSGTPITVPSISAGQFYDITYKVNGTSTSVYIDGSFIDTVTTADSALFNGLGGIFRIGFGATYGDVSFGNAVVWDRELTDTEIAGLPNLDFPVSGMVCGYTCGDGEGELWDISGNDYAMSNDGTIELTTADGLVNWFLLKGGRRSSDVYTFTEPSSGFRYSFDPNTDTLTDAFDVLATVMSDTVGETEGSWSVTEPIGGWVTEFDATSASMQDLLNVVATLANDLPTSENSYTLVPPTQSEYSFNPNTDTLSTAINVFGALLVDLQTYGVIK